MPLPKKRHHSHLGEINSSQTLASETVRSGTDATNEFFVDRKGDPKNLDFGSLHQSAVSTYRRSGAGYVLGSGNRRIDRANTSHKNVMLIIDGPLDHRERNALAKAFKGPSKKLRVKPEQASKNATDLNADFLCLSQPSEKKRKRIETDQIISSSTDDEGHHYRSVQGKAKTSTHPDDKDLIYSSEASASEHEDAGRIFDLDDKNRHERGVLTRALEEDPTNMEKWLQLIGLQDGASRLDQISGLPRSTSAEKRSNAEIKVSLYEKAIAAVSVSNDKEYLIAAMMGEVSHVWDIPRIQTKWRNILRDYSSSKTLWTTYMNFRTTTFVSFKYEDALAEYMIALKDIRNCRKSHNGVDSGAEPQSSVLPLMLRLTLFMTEAGFTERAIAIWQALLESRYYRPEEYRALRGDADQDTEAQALVAFEEFWESEVPRIGENDAYGWAASSSGAVEAPAAKADAIMDVRSSSDIYSQLAYLEQLQSMQAMFPGRTIDDVTEDDPFRIILYSDVREILDAFPITRHKQIDILDSFLAFCHLPPLHDMVPAVNARLSYRDPFLRNDVLDLAPASVKAWKLYTQGEEPTTSDGTEPPHHSPHFDTPIVDYAISTDTLFAAKGSWFSPIDHWLLKYSQDQGPVPIEWIRRTIRALIDIGIGGDPLSELFLALELRLSPSTVTKTAKKLIKARPTSIRLYNAHVCIEFYLGHHERAKQTLVATINTSRNMPESSQRDVILLWQTWIWELLTSSREKDALERLLSYPDNQLATEHTKHVNEVFTNIHANPTTLLRAQQALLASRDHFLSLSLPSHSVAASDLLVLLSYLTSSQSLSATQSTFSTQLTALSTHFQPTPLPHELLHQSFARLLHHHATHIPLFKPATIREALAISIALFPQNTIFLSLYAWNESRFRIDDRVRSIIKDIVLNPKDKSSHRDNEESESITPHLFAIYSELNRSPIFGSNTNTIRATFERAVASAAGAHFAGIWKLYVLFEHRRGDKARAKGVWWRGVRACPWVKALWMMAFGEIRDVMGDNELKEVWELMGEKELRLHTDLEKLLERREEGNEDSKR